MMHHKYQSDLIFRNIGSVNLTKNLFSIAYASIWELFKETYKISEVNWLDVRLVMWFAR